MSEPIIEKCCGFIVYRLYDDGQKYLLLYQRKSKTWSFPKGHAEPGENELATAVRELYEETGLTAEPVCSFRREMTYPIGENRYKNVVLFLTALVGDEPNIKQDEIADFSWLTAAEVIEKMPGRRVAPLISVADHYAVSVFLRDLLNGVPCVSGNEYTMKEFISSFLSNSTTLEIQDMGNWLFAVHEEDASLPWIAVRADIDAILDSDGKPFHGCGHDGHSSVIACLAALQSNLKLGKNIIYIFQPEEETGAGADKCVPILQRYNVGEIYGFHNIPGYKTGTLLMRDGTFACSSFGLTLRFIGRQAHAAYPERGINPCLMMAKFLNFWDSFFEDKIYRGIVKGTVVGMNSYAVNFGISPSVCDLSMTLRGEYEDDLDKLESSIYDVANEIADACGLDMKNFYADYFPATSNDAGLSQKARRLFDGDDNKFLLPEPMLWSEDFSKYSAVCKTYYFGIGSGEDAAELHSDDYEWNDLINWRAIEILRKLTEN